MLTPLEDRPCLGYAALVVSLPTLLSLLLAWPGRRFLSVAALRGSTTTEKRTALFVWRSIATRQLRDCNVGTVEPTLSPSTPRFPSPLPPFILYTTLYPCFRLACARPPVSSQLRSFFDFEIPTIRVVSLLSSRWTKMDPSV